MMHTTTYRFERVDVAEGRRPPVCIECGGVCGEESVRLRAVRLIDGRAQGGTSAIVCSDECADVRETHLRIALT